ncbi:hypothetical protein POTOM_044923 [Populus tomentosa]|uniref:Pectinesterase inhibitor domain-containing protein n=1 Tax=Populus tomentosa TaxID=118781 RepID=A0A8X7YSP1_POPTO|nr:hypothetical protein POTOM_044923 [Populus tomentosa]
MVKFAGRAYGLDTLPPQISEEGGNVKSLGKEREDECVEIELGSFYNDGGDAKEVEEMCQKEVPGEHLKGGLVVEGIELRPKKMVKTMGSKNRIMIFAAIFLHLFLHFPSQTEAGAESVSEVCKQSQDYQSCVQILTSHPQTPSASGKKAIAEKALALARKESVDTSDFFTGLAHRNPASKTVLEKCASYFKEAVTFLNLKGLEGGTASLDVHYALDDAESCESALSSGHVHIHSATARILKWKTVYEAAEAAVIALEN